MSLVCNNRHGLEEDAQKTRYKPVLIGCRDREADPSTTSGYKESQPRKDVSALDAALSEHFR